MAFAIKAGIRDPRARSFAFSAQKTMYGGKVIAAGDVVYLFAGKASKRPGLIARGTVVQSKPVEKIAGLARQTPRVDLTIRLTQKSLRALARGQLCRFTDWDDGKPETELNFKLYRQATNKVVGISDEVSIYLDTFFE